MKKITSLFLATTAALGCAFFGTGCVADDKPDSDPNTVNVRLYKAGFGDTFIYELQEMFETVYAEEGYKMNILEPSLDSAGVPMLREMSRGYIGYDLYITGAIMPNQVTKDSEYGKVRGEELCEDLESLVFDQKAINYDGTQSEDKIIDRIHADYVPFQRANDGTMYGFTWAQTSAGMVVNMEKLAKYGVTELPRTTKELFQVFDWIYEGRTFTDKDGKEVTVAGSKDTKLYPITYNLDTGSGGASTYQNCAFDTWLAQFDIETYNEFWRMEEFNNGVWGPMEDAYKVFENENIRDVLEASYQLMDIKYSTGNLRLNTAQDKVMKPGGAVFMLNGDWFLNEVKANNERYLKDIAFMNVPVLSKIGLDLFGEGTTYNLSEAECDELLSYICKLVDERKTLTEIVENVQAVKGIELQEADAKKVAEARGVTFARGIEHLAFITKGSTKKDIAALVLRMMASDDFAETFLREANASSPYAQELDIESKYSFVNDAKALVLSPYFRAINSRVGNTRFEILKTDKMFPGISNLAKDMYDASTDKKNTYKSSAETLYEYGKTEAKKAWDNWNK